MLTLVNVPTAPIKMTIQPNGWARFTDKSTKKVYTIYFDNPSGRNIPVSLEVNLHETHFILGRVSEIVEFLPVVAKEPIRFEFD